MVFWVNARPLHVRGTHARAMHLSTTTPCPAAELSQMMLDASSSICPHPLHLRKSHPTLVSLSDLSTASFPTTTKMGPATVNWGPIDCLVPHEHYPQVIHR